LKLHTCGDCGGSGIFRDKISTCCFCEGTGQMTDKQMKAYRSWLSCQQDKAKEELNKVVPPELL